MLLLVILGLVSLAIAQVPRPCQSPPQWEARLYSYNEQRNLVVSGKLTYDSIYQRVRILEDIRVGDDDSHYNIIRLFQGKLEFTVDLKTGNCSRRPLERPWRDIGVLPDAQSRGEAYVGSSALPGAGLLVTIWTGNETFAQNRTTNYLQTWTYEACLPVSDTSFDSAYGTSHSSFYDVTVGISNPNVFIPPRQCLTDKEYAMRDVLFGTLMSKKHN